MLLYPVILLTYIFDSLPSPFMHLFKVSLILFPHDSDLRSETPNPVLTPNPPKPPENTHQAHRKPVLGIDFGLKPCYNSLHWFFILERWPSG